MGVLFGSLSRAAMSAAQRRAIEASKDASEGYGNRLDGTAKGRGHLGEIAAPDGRVMTEYSIGVDFGQGEQEIPTLVPGLSPEQIDMIRREQIDDDIVRKAVEFAKVRMGWGLSPFAVRGWDYF
jgi:hypothetical protein